MHLPEPPPYIRYDAAARHLSLDPHCPDFVDDPYPAYAYLNAIGGLFFWEEYGRWCAGSFDAVSRLLRDRRLGRQALPESALRAGREHLAAFDAVDTNSMLELEPPAHTRLRTLVNRAFVSRQVERLRPRIERLAHELVDSFAREGTVDLLPLFAAPLPITIIAEMLGVPAAMGQQMLDWSHRMVAMYMHGRTRAIEIDADRAASEFGDFIRRQAAERLLSPDDDLLTLLLSARENGGRLSEDELVSSVILLLNAGHEATVHQTGNAVRAILLQGGDPRRFFVDDATGAATVEECLRFDAPLHMFARTAYETVELADGVALERGSEIGLLLGAANRDRGAFASPDRFDPDRRDQKNVSFGAGIHFCIGAPLARLELQVALKVLFDRLPELRLADTPKYRDSYHFHGLEALIVAI